MQTHTLIRKKYFQSNASEANIAIKEGKQQKDKAPDPNQDTLGDQDTLSSVQPHPNNLARSWFNRFTQTVVNTNWVQHREDPELEE